MNIMRYESTETDGDREAKRRREILRIIVEIKSSTMQIRLGEKWDGEVKARRLTLNPIKVRRHHSTLQQTLTDSELSHSSFIS